MQTGRRIRVRAGSGLAAADPNLNLFSATLAQNAGLNGRIKLPEALAAGRVAQGIIRGIQVVSVDVNIWEFWFWANSKFQVAGPDASAESFRGRTAFAAAGLQIAGTGLAYADVNGLDIFYEDDEAGLTQNVTTSQGAYLNVTLVNRSAGAKTVNGWFQVTFVIEPTQGQ